MTLKPPTAGNSPIIRSNVINIQDYGARGDGSTDDTASFEAAVSALGAGGGTVYFPGVGHVYRFATSPDLNGLSGVKLQGEVGFGQDGLANTSKLEYTGTGARFIDGRLTRGLVIEDLVITHTNGSFTGPLVDLSGTDANTPTNFARFNRVRFSGTASPSAVGVALALVIDVSFTDCMWEELAQGVTGALADPVTSFSNCVRFRGGYFSSNITGAAIRNPGQQWTLEGVVFEPRAGGACGAIVCDYRTQALVILGCGFWDGGSSGAWITARGEGTLISGCLFGAQEGTSLGVDATHTDNVGMVVVGNTFQGTKTGVALNTGRPDTLVKANKWSTVTTKVAASGQAYAATSGEYDTAASGTSPAPYLSAAASRRLEGNLLATAEIYAQIDSTFTGIGHLGPGSEPAVKMHTDVIAYRNASAQPTLRVNVPVTVATYTSAGKPAATDVPAGTLIFVSDGGGGAVFQGSTGAAWVSLG